MRDGPVRRVLKGLALVLFTINLKATRAIRRARGDVPYRLGGSCGRCAACCEMPGIQIGRLVWYLPTFRWLFLAWHRHVNGFILVDRDIHHRVFLFRCTHFDARERRCDSYDSRPGMCRDYPRSQLWEVNPAFLKGCGYRPVHPKASAFLESLKEENLPEEKLEEVKKRLHLEE